MKIRLNSKITLAIATVSFVALNSFAGPNSSGGGMVVHCQNESGSNVKLLDYYESEVLYGEKNVEKATGSLENDFLRLVTNTYYLQGHVVDHAKFSKENLKEFLKRIDWVQSNDLNFLNDHGSTIALPNSCKLKQLAIFYDNNESIKVAKDLWDQMDSMNQAALIEHELFYYYERKYSELNSISTRSYIHQLLTAGIQQPANFDEHNANLICFSSSENGEVAFRFFVFQNEKTSRLQFTQFASRPLLVLTESEVSTPFAVRTKLNGNRFEAWPKDLKVNLNEVIQVESNHREDWSLKLEFVGSKPVTLQALKEGRPLTNPTTIDCYRQ